MKKTTDGRTNNPLKEGFVDEDEVKHRAFGLSDLKELLEKYPPSRGVEVTGCAESQIMEAARMIDQSKAMLAFWFQGYNHSKQLLLRATRVTQAGI